MNSGMRQLLEDIVETSGAVWLQRQELGLARALQSAGYVVINKDGLAAATSKGIGFCTGENE